MNFYFSPNTYKKKSAGFKQKSSFFRRGAFFYLNPSFTQNRTSSTWIYEIMINCGDKHNILKGKTIILACQIKKQY
jgi:hypothetical protein